MQELTKKTVKAVLAAVILGIPFVIGIVWLRYNQLLYTESTQPTTETTITSASAD